jgi:repressor LexA
MSLMALTRRQKQILDYIQDFVERNGYSPSLEEIGQYFGLSSVATVHKHVTNLVRKGLLRRTWNQNRSIEVVREDDAPRAVEVSLIGKIRDGRPVEQPEELETLTLPSWLMGQGRTYALRVEGDSLRSEQMRDGDFVVVEERRSAESGQLAVVLLHGDDLTIRRLRNEGPTVRLDRPGAAAEGEPMPRDRIEVKGVIRGVVRKC